VLRSSQLDAQRLDAELQTMLHEQFMAMFQLLPQVRDSNWLGFFLSASPSGSAPMLTVKQGKCLV
jgi:hypothetical protein